MKNKKKINKGVQRILDILLEKHLCFHCRKKFGETQCIFSSQWKKSLPVRLKDVVRFLEEKHHL